jgi:carbonic anhydrase
MTSLLSRRSLVQALACSCAALPSGLVATSGAAQVVPRAADTPDRALELLKQGNATFVKGGACIPTGGAERVAELARGQAPFAVIVGCADSRTPPEHLFGRGLGELFVVRVAGNTVDTAALGSIEYAVAVLGAPLIFVLGHSKCGAVEAATKIVKENATFPGSIGEMVEPIVPAVLRAQRQGGDLLEASIRENVAAVMERLRTSSAILKGPLDAGRLKIAGGVYDLQSGAVSFMA